MQVVYSGGSTPKPSPRIRRKTGYGRPIMPGYMTHVHPQVMTQRSHENLTEGDVTLRDSIPAMSRCVASICLVFNIFLPGAGTLIAGLSVLCCSHVRPKDDSKRHCIYVNAGVALIQFMLTFLFLLGWIWSIMWGIAFLSVSKQYYYRHQDEQSAQEHNGVNKSSSEQNNTSTPNLNVKTKNNYQHRLDSNPLEKKSNNISKVHRLSSRTSSLESQSSGVNPHCTVTNLATSRVADKQKAALDQATFCECSDAYQVRPDTMPPQPIIALQKASVSNLFEASHTVHPASSGETIMKATTRHMKMMQRKMSSNELSPFALTHKRLEAIIKHDIPVIAPDNRHTGEPQVPGEGLPKC
ncbi:unnamed protein product [Candidula unifasciata]|uniref:Protein SPEC3 n=1 Tax=Candidula unifasciata TaxID=100452 RepID=A0A8S3ZDF3_9EUPU|nr:unnamed protein product [Candidula unifasciata]